MTMTDSLQLVSSGVLYTRFLAVLAPAVAPAQEGPPRPLLRKMIQFEEAPSGPQIPEMGRPTRGPGRALSERKTRMKRTVNPVTLRVGMQSLPDGTRHPGSVVLGMPASQIEVRITNSSYQKLAP